MKDKVPNIAVIAVFITGLFTHISKDSSTMIQSVCENGKTAIHAGNGDIKQ